MSFPSDFNEEVGIRRKSILKQSINFRDSCKWTLSYLVFFYYRVDKTLFFSNLKTACKSVISAIWLYKLTKSTKNQSSNRVPVERIFVLSPYQNIQSSGNSTKYFCRTRWPPILNMTSDLRHFYRICPRSSVFRQPHCFPTPLAMYTGTNIHPSDMMMNTAWNESSYIIYIIG